MKRALIILSTLFFFIFIHATGRSDSSTYDSFFKNLEFLLDNYGNNQNSWPECQQKSDIQKYIMINYNRTINECIFGKNLLGYGIFQSPDNANKDLKDGLFDPWGKKYDKITASSPDGNKLFDIYRAIGNNQDQTFYNKEINDKLYIFLKADLHSQCADVFRNFNGKEFRIIARELNLMGAPGSAYKGYKDDISSAVAAAHCEKVVIWVGKNDKITKLPSKIKPTTAEGLLGLKVTFKIGEKQNCFIAAINLDGVGHERLSYNEGIHKLTGKPTYVITTQTGARVLVESSFDKFKTWSGEKWTIIDEKNGWVLVRRGDSPESEAIAILITNDDDQPENIAEKINERNNTEHPEQKAIVILDGDPNSKRNKEICKELKNKGYVDDDILVVNNGDLFTKDGELIAKGEDIIPEEALENSLLTQGIWGHMIQELSGRPVYAVKTFPSDEENKFEEKRRFGIDHEKVATGGVHIDIKTNIFENDSTNLKNEILNARPKNDTLIWNIKLLKENEQ